MAGILFPPGFRVVDANGKPASGAKLYVYEAGTTTEKATWQNAALNVAHQFPIVCDSGGKPANSGGTAKLVYIAGGANIKVKATTSADATLWEYDDYAIAVSDNGTVAVAAGGTGSTTAGGALTNLGAASDADLDTLSTTVSAIDGQIDDIGGALGDLAGKDTVAYTDLATGFDAVCIQRVRTTTASKVALSGATVPQDSTTPQSSEGEEVFSQSFTPIRSDSTIRVRCAYTLEYAANRQGIIMLFTDASANCIQAAHRSFVSDQPNTHYLEHEFASPGTSAVTISVRVGADSTTAPTRNGPHFSTVPISWLVIEEVVDTPVA